ncbi:hypothetical protein LR48_Vigan03g155100 [Vigna angularis]|uniref:Uncharacterized protein n=1 Tax=Phaseolus angularis TaxID=3914 RepID=A0A0L9U6U7_PHAAN|nr:hypothetical protein LR48_Vigan03g155100 [Vigna angularis]
MALNALVGAPKRQLSASNGVQRLRWGAQSKVARYISTYIDGIPFSHGQASIRRVEVIHEDGLNSTFWTTFRAIMEYNLE